mmetsp:Transcript_15889/g.31624  ORF Transcript_15889/g.31624 Transcript_15889/m.31624 type:complete len:304 (+) Transcript_15889:56-967(+)
MPLGTVDRTERETSHPAAPPAQSGPIGGRLPPLGSPGPPQSSSSYSSSVGGSFLGSAVASILGGIDSGSGVGRNRSAPSPGGAGGRNGRNEGGSARHSVTIYGKDGRWIRFTVASVGDAIHAYEALDTYAFPGRRNIEYLFAFECRKADRHMGGTQVTYRPPALPRYDAAAEFARQGVLGLREGDQPGPWRMCHINSDFGVSLEVRGDRALPAPARAAALFTRMGQDEPGERPRAAPARPVLPHLRRVPAPDREGLAGVRSPLPDPLLPRRGTGGAQRGPVRPHIPPLPGLCLAARRAAPHGF